MATEHVNIADAQLHEPKGAASATAGTVYVSDGGGSGSWTDAPYKAVVCALIDDVSTSDTVYVAAPVAGTISKIYATLGGAITTADATLSSTVNGTTITGGGATVAYSGSAAGDVITATPSANNTVVAGDYISVSTDGGSSTAQKLHIVIVIDVG